MFKINELVKVVKAVQISGRKGTLIRGISIDSRTIKPQEAFIAIKGSNFDGHNFIDKAISKGAGAVIYETPLRLGRGKQVRRHKSQENVTFMKVRDTVKALGDIARFQREKFDIPVIAITGSNGKTTTKEMIAYVLSEKFKVLKNEGTKNNHIGLPLTLLKLDNSYDVAVLEAGTNHPGEIDYLAGIALPNIGVITNIGPSHLAHFNNLSEVRKEKLSLLKYLKSPRIAILNSDDRFLRNKSVEKNKISKSIIFGFSKNQKGDFFASDITVNNNEIKFLVNKRHRFRLKTLGYCNIYNALPAIAIARILGMGYNDISAKIANFSSLNNRLKLVELDKIKFINDTYNSNPVSLKQAIDALQSLRVKGRKILIMGDMLELGNSERSFHVQAGRHAAGVCDALIAVGRLSRAAAKAARESGFDVKNIFTCDTSREARDILLNELAPSENDVVLVKGSRAMMMEEVISK